MKKHFIRLAAAGGAAIALLAPTAVGAISTPTGAFSNLTGANGAIQTIINLLVGVAGTILVIMLVIGGIRYLTNAGNEEEVGKAKKLLIDAIIGLIITLAAYAIGTYVTNQLGGSTTTL